MNGCWILSNASSASIEMIMWLLSFVYFVYHIDWLAYVEPYLWSWDESHMALVCGLFYVLLDSVCEYSVDKFHICIHQRYWPIIFFLVLSSVLVSGWWWLHRGLPWWLRWWRIHLQFRRLGFDPWVGKVPWRRAWHPTPVFLPGESHGQGSLVGYSPWGSKELDMTKWLFLGSVSSSSIFLEKFKKDQYNFFVCLVEFACEAIWSWTFVSKGFLLLLLLLQILFHF